MADEFQNLFEDNFLDDIKATPTEKLKDGERRIVSILFADISGFTKLSEKMDHEEVRDIIDKLFKLFTSSVERHGGYVDKYAGDEIMALFGAKVASEVDTHRAISCGMDMLDKLNKFNDYLIGNSKYNITEENKLSMRVGINTGMVTTGSIGKGREGDFTVYGEVVNLASRMESNAPINRIMVPEKTMVQAKRNFSFKNHGAIEVKGFEKKISVFLVESEHGAKETKKSAPYLGSRDNIELLLDIYKSSSESLDQYDRSDLCAVGIKGEAGIGKSRLISEFINTSSQGISSNNVVRVASDNVAISPYQTFISIIKKSLLIERADSKNVILQKFERGFNELVDVVDGELAGQLIKFKARIAYLIGLKIDKGISNVSGVDLRDEIQLSIRIFLQAICKKSNLSNVPLIIIVDDLQWIDSASMDVLNKIFDMESIGISKDDQRNQALYFILDYRETYKVPDFITKAKTFKEITVSPFTSGECRDMISHVMSEDVVPDEVVKVLMKHSGGNPFFIEEWLKSLSDEVQWSSSDISKWISSIPESMHSLILSSVDTLDERSRKVLQCASVIGRKFSASMIKELEGKVDNLRDVSRSLEVLQKEKIIVLESDEKGIYTFKNAITRDVAYDSILKSNKSMLHEILAGLIEVEFIDGKTELLYQLANHYGRSGDTAKAKEYLIKGAKKSQESYSLYHANNLYKRAIDIYLSSDSNLNSILDGSIKNINNDDATEFIKIIHRYGNILMLLGEMDECEKILKSINKVLESDLNDKGMQCNILGTIGRMYFLRGKYSDAQFNFSQQLSQARKLSNFEDECNALHYIARIHIMRGEYKDSIVKLDKLKNQAKDNESLLNQVLGDLGIVHKNMGNLDKALEYYSLQEKICKKNNYTSSLLIVLGNIATVYRHQGKNNESLDMLDRVLILNQDLGDKSVSSKAHGNKGIALKNLDRFDDALHEYEMQLKICEYSRDIQGIGIANSNKGNTYKLIKEYDKAINCFKNALEISIETGNKREEGISLANIGETLMEMNEYKESEEYLNNALKIFRDNGDKDLEKIIIDDLKKLESKL